MGKETLQATPSGLADVVVADPGMITHLGQKVNTFFEKHPSTPRTVLKGHFSTEFFGISVSDGTVELVACRHDKPEIDNSNVEDPTKNIQLLTWFVRQPDGQLSALVDDLTPEYEMMESGDFEGLVARRQARPQEVVDSEDRTLLTEKQAVMLGRVLNMTEVALMKDASRA